MHNLNVYSEFCVSVTSELSFIVYLILCIDKNLFLPVVVKLSRNAIIFFLIAVINLKSKMTGAFRIVLLNPLIREFFLFAARLSYSDVFPRIFEPITFSFVVAIFSTIPKSDLMDFFVLIGVASMFLDGFSEIYIGIDSSILF